MRVTITSPEILARLVSDNTPVYFDSVADICKQAVLSNDFEEITSYVDGQIQKGKSETVAAVLACISEHPNPELTVAVMALIIGGSVIGNEYQAKIAKRFGISKSAVCQRESLLRERLGWVCKSSGIHYDYVDDFWKPPEEKEISDDDGEQQEQEID